MRVQAHRAGPAGEQYSAVQVEWKNDVARLIENPMTSDVLLRDVTEADLPIFFEQQRDGRQPDGRLSRPDPADRERPSRRNGPRSLRDDTVTKKAILVNGQVAGSVSALRPLVGANSKSPIGLARSIGAEGIATKALTAFWAT